MSKSKYPGPWKQVSKVLNPELRVFIAKGHLHLRTEYQITYQRILNSKGDRDYMKEIVPGPTLNNIYESLHLGEKQLNLLALMEGGVNLIEILVKRYEDWHYRKSKTWERHEKARRAEEKRWRAKEKIRKQKEKEETKRRRLLELAKKKAEKEAAAEKKAEEDAKLKAELLAQKKAEEEKKKLEAAEKAAQEEANLAKKELKKKRFNPLKKFQRTLEI